MTVASELTASEPLLATPHPPFGRLPRFAEKGRLADRLQP